MSTSGFPTQTGWYNIQFSTTLGASPSVFLGQAQDTNMGYVFLPGTQSSQVQFYIDAPSKKIALPSDPTIPVSSQSPYWLSVNSSCNALAGVVQSSADTWSIGSNGALTNQTSAFWDRGIYTVINPNCSGGTPGLFPIFTFLRGVSSNLPSQSGWYYLTTSANPPFGTNINWTGSDLALGTGPPATKMYFDAATSKLAVAPAQPWGVIQGWLNVGDLSGCYSYSGAQIHFSLTTEDNATVWASDVTDQYMRPAADTRYRWGLSGATMLMDCSQNTPCQPPDWYCPTLAAAVTFAAVPSSPPDMITVLQSILQEVDPSSPDYAVCQGGSGNQLCFYNRSSKTPKVAAFPDISPDPNAVIGYNKGVVFGAQSQTRDPWLSGASPQVFLGPPDDAMQLNNMQPSICFDENCVCPGESPQQCATSPDGYCYCQAGTSSVVCGLSCLPGTVPVKVGSCAYDPLHGVYLSHYQCFPTNVYGIVNQDNSQSCVQYEGPNPPSGTRYNSMQDCIEQWADCPAGYTRYEQSGRPGCYRVGDYKRNWSTCDTPFSSCSADDQCSAFEWQSHCSGSCPAHTCDCYCQDTSTVPPWGYWCQSTDVSQWVQNQTDSAVQVATAAASFDTNGAFCVYGSSPYGN